jgi:hypothetical protein
MERRAIGLGLFLAMTVAACGNETAPTPGPSGSGGPASSTPPAAALIDQANFVAGVDNPWFPLKPGARYTYRGTKDGQPAVDVLLVTAATKIVDGVACVVVRDTLRLGGVVAERTEDWYAQDRDGNVWYFGEATSELNAQGKVVSTEGSWESGVDGALPGIYMPAEPKVGQSLAQEHYAGHAEDWFVVLFTSTKVKVPAGTFKNAMVTGEWTPLEPGVFGEKWYVKGTGQVKEADVTGGSEELSLAKITGP